MFAVGPSKNLFECGEYALHVSWVGPVDRMRVPIKGPTPLSGCVPTLHRRRIHRCRIETLVFECHLNPSYHAEVATRLTKGVPCPSMDQIGAHERCSYAVRSSAA